MRLTTIILARPVTGKGRDDERLPVEANLVEGSFSKPGGICHVAKFYFPC
jgi:hypothetical protein